jgi:hypothetical protein
LNVEQTCHFGSSRQQAALDTDADWLVGSNTPVAPTPTPPQVGSTYMYESMEHAEEAVRRSGQLLAAHGSPEELGPLVFTFTGDGKVGDV